MRRDSRPIRRWPIPPTPRAFSAPKITTKRALRLPCASRSSWTAAAPLSSASPPPFSLMPPILHALASLDDYVAAFSSAPLPVLRRTVRELAALEADHEAIAGRQITAVVLNDPLMTLRLLIHLERHRSGKQNHDITTIDRAIMMMGVTPFFRAFADMPTLEDSLADHSAALVGVLRVIARARRAALYAREWAIVRHDLNVEEITVGALLYDTADMLCGIFAPTLTQQVYKRQRADRSLRSAVAQRDAFNFTANEIQLALSRAWRLPDLLVTLMDQATARNPRVRTVVLANALARHIARGWDNPAIPDDLDAIAKLLRINRAQMIRQLAIPAEHAERLLPETPEPSP